MAAPTNIKLTKAERAQLRSLAEEAWNQELTEKLTDLYEDFCRWGGDEISAFELTDRIHTFHDGAARELYKRYALCDSVTAVSSAIAAGVIDKDELDASLKKKIARVIELFESISCDEVNADDASSVKGRL